MVSEAAHGICDGQDIADQAGGSVRHSRGYIHPHATCVSLLNSTTQPQRLSQVGPRLVGLEEAMAAYGLLKSEVFHDPSSDTKMLMAWSKTMLICTFRGTDSWANARSDIQVCIVHVMLCLRQAVPNECMYKVVHQTMPQHCLLTR